MWSFPYEQKPDFHIYSQKTFLNVFGKVLYCLVTFQIITCNLKNNFWGKKTSAGFRVRSSAESSREFSVQKIVDFCTYFCHFFRTNFETAYRSEFLSDFNNRMCVEKLTSRRIQKNKFYLMCTHQAQNRFKIVNPHILAILRAKCTQEK